MDQEYARKMLVRRLRRWTRYFLSCPVMFTVSVVAAHDATATQYSSCVGLIRRSAFGWCLEWCAVALCVVFVSSVSSFV